ncbi:CAP domain-containing protein [Natronobeatus ordinarius]|uniref:CAP domain-containing protein n=1 Tax=Natronobeatus ordinarius TaxID=2963433 RepID=UPI0020CF1882|nr:CAP domain-containing protein [Natronobeatus ordinarius]
MTGRSRSTVVIAVIGLLLTTAVGVGAVASGPAGAQPNVEGLASSDDDDAVEPNLETGDSGAGTDRINEDRTVDEYAGDDGVVDTDGLRDAIDDWRSGTTDTDLLRDVIDAWRTSDETGDGGALDRTLVEQYVHEAVNEERAARGLEELEFDEELQTIARTHSEDMAERGYFAHTDPDGNSFADRYDEHGYDCRADAGGGYYYIGGENIAHTHFDKPVRTDSGEIVRYTDERELADGIVEGWMNSDGHRENLLADHWTNEGIGISVTDDDEVYATQNFC